MPVATQNPFAILEDIDSSPSPTPAPAPSAPAPAAAAPPPPKTSRTGPRGGRYPSRGGGPRPAPTGTDSSAPNETQQAAVTNEERQKYGQTRGRGRGRGGDRDGRKQTGTGRPRMDRHSATGKTDSDKKIHQSWGGDKGPDEVDAVVAASNDASKEMERDGNVALVDNSWGGTADAVDDTWGDTTGNATAATAATAAELVDNTEKAPEFRARRGTAEEEPDTTLTLDQYYAQQQPISVPKLEARKADVSENWKDVTQFKRVEDEYFSGKPKQPKARSKKEKEKKEEIFLDFNAPPPPSGGRGRGNRFRGDDSRGGGRGRGGRGGRGGGRDGQEGRDGRERHESHRQPNGGNGAAAVDVDDQTAFPSLS